MSTDSERAQRVAARLRGLLPGGFYRGMGLTKNRLAEALHDPIYMVDARAQHAVEDTDLPLPKPRYKAIVAELRRLLTSNTSGYEKLKGVADLLECPYDGTMFSIAGAHHSVDWLIVRSSTEPTIIIEDNSFIYLKSWADYRRSILALGADTLPSS